MNDGDIQYRTKPKNEDGLRPFRYLFWIGIATMLLAYALMVVADVLSPGSMMALVSLLLGGSGALMTMCAWSCAFFFTNGPYPK